MARFRFAVFKERLELLTPTKGISDNLNTDSASFDFRTPEWEGLSKWAHFTNYDYEGGVEYDFNLINDEIPVDEGLNLPPGVWDVYVHAEVIDAQAIVRRLVTNVVSIVSDQSDAYDGQYLPPIGPSVAEQIDAKATAAWDAKITSASAEIHNDVGEAYADLEITGENGNKNLHFDFHNIKGDPGSDGEPGPQGDPGNSIYSIVRTSGTGAPGTVDTYTVTLTDGTIGGTFEVYNGADGAGTVQSVSGILPDASGDIPLIIFGTGAPTTSTVGYEKQLYFDTTSSLIYMCTDDSDPYVWALASGSVTGVKGDAESTYRTGNVNITAANVGAVPVTRTVNSKALSSNISLDYSDVSASPIDHASANTTYGKGTDASYGHVKLSDSTSSTSTVSGGTAATPKAVKDAYDLADSKTSAMIVDVSNTQPTDPDNKLWIPEVVTETQVPTWEEYLDIVKVQDTEPTEEGNQIWVSEGTQMQVPTYAEHQALSSALSGVETQASKYKWDRLYRFAIPQGTSVAASGTPDIVKSWTYDDTVYVNNGKIHLTGNGFTFIYAHVPGSTSNTGRLWFKLKGTNSEPQHISYGSYCTGDMMVINQHNTTSNNEIWLEFIEPFNIGGGSTGAALIYVIYLT